MAENEKDNEEKDEDEGLSQERKRAKVGECDEEGKEAWEGMKEDEEER